MHDIKSQSQLAESAADMMRACALATARAASASMSRSISLWSQMLRVSVPQSDTRAELTEPAERTEPQAPVEPQADPAFSNYRSSGGHAVAQVIVADPAP